MKIRTQKEGNVVVISLTGKLTYPEATADFRQAWRQMEEDGERFIVLDLRGVPWIDSSGLGEVVACFTSAQDRGGAVKLVFPEKPLSAFSYTQVEHLFEIFDSPEQAVASFGNP